MSGSMRAGGQTRTSRDVQRAVDQLRLVVDRQKSAQDREVASLRSEVAALRAQLGAIIDSDDDGLPDLLELDGGGA